MAKVKPTRGALKQSSRRVSFKVKLDGAKEVVVTGGFTRWAKDELRLTKSPNGDWTGTIELSPGEYQYRLLVDGQWRDDPTAEARVPNEFGSTNCVLKVS